MGADQHYWVEVKRPRHDGSERWVLLDGEDDEIFDYPYYDPDRPVGEWNRPKTSRPLTRRNYTLFALMADVRNGYGFAGVPTGDAITPLSEPRGVPDDASYAYLAEVDGWDVDGHSHTWFPLPELIDHPLYDQRLVRTGVISGKAYEKLRDEGGKPEEWSGRIHGQGIITVTPEQYDAGMRGTEYTPAQIEQMRKAWRAGGLSERFSVEEIDKRLQDHIDEGRTYVQYVWEDSLRDSIEELTTAVAKLIEWANDTSNHWGGKPIPLENIRLVGFYDN